jgi:hypothetical protein
MTNKTEPIWTEKKVQTTAEELYKKFSKELDKDPKIAFSLILREFCFLIPRHNQLQEAYFHNSKVSKGAFDNSNLAVQKYQQLDGIFKTSTSSFSKRLEKLER